MSLRRNILLSPPASLRLTVFRHKQKNVDLSVPFRISGLAGGAKLDLVVGSKSPAPVAVAVSIPPPDGQAFNNGRLGGKFPSSFTIWQILRQIENLPEAINAKLNITARGVAATTDGQMSGSGQLLYEAPVLNVMGRELSSFPDYQKTLSQLGYNSGSVLIRLTYKTPGITFFEAQQQIAQYFKDLEEAEAKKPVPSPQAPGQPPAPAQGATTEAQEAMKHSTSDDPGPADEHTTQAALPVSADATSEEQPSSAPQDPLAPVGIFSAPSSSTPAAARTEFSEDDFIPTVAHAQLHQARLQESSKNKRLLSDKQLEEQAAATEEKLLSVQSIEVKVRFPDNTSASWVITHDDTGAKLYKAVRSVMADPTLPFRLVVPGSKDMIRESDSPDNRIIRAYKFTGRVLVNLIWDDSVSAAARANPFLKSSAAQAAKDIVVPEVPVVEEEDTSPAQEQQQKPKQPRPGDDPMKKIGKFFKLPGKK